MPTYNYSCSDCGTMEVSHAMGESLTICPKCGMLSVKRVYAVGGVSFKGSGFYSTDSKKSTKD